MTLRWNFIEAGLFYRQSFLEKLDVVASIKGRARNCGQEGHMAQEVSKGQLPIFQPIICDFLWHAQTFEHGKKHLFEDIVILDLSLEDEGDRDVEELLLFFFF